MKIIHLSTNVKFFLILLISLSALGISKAQTQYDFIIRNGTNYYPSNLKESWQGSTPPNGTFKGIYIGTTQPAATFHFKSLPGVSQPVFRIDGTLSQFDPLYVDFCSYYQNKYYGIYQIGPNDAMNYFYNNVGIGTGKEIPACALDVDGDIHCSNIKITSNPALNFILASDNQGNGIWTDPSTFHYDWLVETLQGDSYFDQNLYSNPRYTNVGIGTTSPKSKLHVMDGNILISRSPSRAPGSQNGSVLFGSVITENCPRGEWGIEYLSGENEDSAIGLNFWKVYTETNQGGNYYLFLKNDGNVGIGTSNPKSKLAVNGKITAKEIEVTLDGFPDYVLKPNYSLRSLDQLEAYIKTHNHLPEVPTESEVSKQGLNLGEMNSLLLKKVEELTLYIISMNKEIEALKAQLSTK